MFKTKLKYSIDPAKQIITLRPTAGTIAKAYLPSLIIGTAIWVAAVASEKKLSKETEDFLKNEDNFKE